MTLGRVVGTVVATQKDPKLRGAKLLIVEQVDLDMRSKANFAVAADAVGAGIGEIVLCVSGSSARLTKGMKDMPVDTAIMAIVDVLEVKGEVRYQKH